MMIATWWGTMEPRTWARSRRSYAWYAASLMILEMSVGIGRRVPSPAAYLGTPLGPECPEVFPNDEPDAVLRVRERQGLVVHEVRPQGDVEDILEGETRSEGFPDGLLR